MAFSPDDTRTHFEAEHGIPDWFFGQLYTLDWYWCEPFSDEEIRRADMTWVEEFVQVAHRNGKCYKITTYTVDDYYETWRTGCYCAAIRVDKLKLILQARRTVRLWQRAGQGALRNWLEPDATDAVDLALKFGSLKVPLLGLLNYSSNVDTLQMDDLVGNYDRITRWMNEILAALKRLEQLATQKPAIKATVARSDTWYSFVDSRSVRVHSSSSMEEIQCTDSILALPEGKLHATDERIIYSELLPRDPERPLSWEELLALLDR